MQYDIEPHYPTYEPPTMSDPRLSSQAPNARSSSVVDQSNHDVFASGLNRETEFVVPDGGLSNPSFSDASMGPMPNGLGPPEENAPETLADYYKIYQIRLHGTVEKYIVSQLTEAIEQLVEITEWLLTHVEELGLTRDEPHLVTQRRQLWDDLNNTWLIILQRQLEQTTKLAATDPDASFPPNLIPERTLKRAGDKLVALANEVEPHGLVDYQMGIWEEQIIEVLVDCRNVYRDRRASRLSRSPSSVPSSVAAEAGRAAKGSAGGGGASGAAGTVFRPPPDPAAAGTVAGTAAADAELPEGWSAVNPR